MEAWWLDFLDDSELVVKDWADDMVSRFEDFKVPGVIREEDFNASSLHCLIDLLIYCHHQDASDLWYFSIWQEDLYLSQQIWMP